MSSSKYFPLAICSIAVTACGDIRNHAESFDAAGYKSATWALTGGYQERKLGENRWKVEAGGNALTSMQRVRLIAKVRAAEIGQEHGFTHFAATDRPKYTCRKSTYDSMPMGHPYTELTATFSHAGSAGFEPIKPFLDENLQRIQLQPSTAEKQAAVDEGRRECAIGDASGKAIAVEDSPL